MKHLYFLKALLFNFFLFLSLYSSAQTPTVVSQGVCGSVVANFNTSDNGFNSPSIYGSILTAHYITMPAEVTGLIIYLH